MIPPSGAYGARGWMARSACLGSLSALLFYAAGCATLMHGTTQQVNIITVPPGAECSVSGVTVRSPAVVQLSRGDSHEVACSLSGFGAVRAMVVRETSLWRIGNIFTGIIPGEVIDNLSGGIDNLSPEVVHLEFSPAAKP